MQAFIHACELACGIARERAHSNAHLEGDEWERMSYRSASRVTGRHAPLNVKESRYVAHAGRRESNLRNGRRPLERKRCEADHRCWRASSMVLEGVRPPIELMPCL
uniref:Uncharacterized protein n=1 Tax=Chrysotila carterae TaxID=13221 RepID=A0A6S9RVH0_CHRCT